MSNVGTIARGIRTPIIKTGDDLEKIVIDSLMKAKETEGFEFHDRDIIAITEAVVGIADGYYVTYDDVAKDIKNKYPKGHIGIVFPTPFSRNRFGPFLKGFAKGANKLTMLISYPNDEVGNKLFDEKLLDKWGVDPSKDILTEDKYQEYFGGYVHEFTGVDYIKYFREVVEAEDCEVEFIFSNNPKVILDYTKDILVANIHNRKKTKEILKEEASTIYTLDEIMNESVDGSNYNKDYGLLGSNRATDDKLKLFPYGKQDFVDGIQKKMKELTGKTLEVMIYGDGAFKDPVGGIWELADPCVSPYYTKGLEGTPNELKLKYFADNKFKNIHGEELAKAMKEEIKNKENLFGKMASLGTTPRRYIDLIGSLCDLISGSGDKGTPIVFIQDYFKTYAD